MLSLLIALLASTLLLSNAIKLEYNSLLDSTPDIIIINQQARKDTTFDESIIDDILLINGVSQAVGRVNGEYEFKKADIIFKIVGIDEFENYSNPFINTLNNSVSLDESTMIISDDIAKILEKNYYKEYFNFIKEDGNFKKLTIKKHFSTQNSLQNKNLVVMQKGVAREIFGFNETEVSDIALSVKNKDEIPFIASKLQEKFSNAKIILRDDTRRFYESIYNYRSGFFFIIFIISFFTFFMILYDRVSGLNSTQKKEIGILKAIGWRVEDVLSAKFYEGIFISFSAYLTGIVSAYIYVFSFQAFYLKGVFLNNYNILYDYQLHFYMDYNVLSILFFMSVPIYILATIIPSWRVATLDADEVMR